MSRSRAPILLESLHAGHVQKVLRNPAFAGKTQRVRQTVFECGHIHDRAHHSLVGGGFLQGAAQSAREIRFCRHGLCIR